MTDEADTPALRARLIAVARGMNAAGLNRGTSGNLSVRVAGGLLLTPTSLPYDRMEPADLALMAFDGSWTGPRRPTSEWRFHRDILAARPEVGAVLHAHATHATALACHHRGIPAFHYMVALAGGGDIRCAPYATFGTEALSRAALAALEGRRACLLGQHGMIVLGATPEAALALAVEVEELARLYLLALTLGPPPILPAEEMELVRARMAQMAYGQDPDAAGPAAVSGTGN